MSDKPLPFVVNDRRKFTPEGEARPDAPPSEPKPAPTPIALAPEPPHTPPTDPEYQPDSVDPSPSPDADFPGEAEGDLPPAPTPEQMEQSRLAFQATAERLDLAIRAANPGADHPPAVSFESLIQSLYMQGIYQLGGGTQEGQQPQVDILGARGSIDLLGIIAEKCGGNLSGSEQRLVDSAIFELRLAFLEITQALARSAQQRAGAAPSMPGSQPGARPGPSIVR